ncbi:ATP-dependent zinc protease family protein [Cerasicoccus frondis]|uniref:ATP-dependent zinc protease family protein n=1 Tax=Cerasicoccus frondis TaxID=490090 RepID=UPI002852C222|nr:RimK/LysX family protein [Cerasicoccus frondis]
MPTATKSKLKREPVPIGWKETIDLPEWGVTNIVAKADTGAKSSALDVRNIKILPNGRVRFILAAHRDDESLTQEIEAKIVKEQKVRSSNGQLQRRVKVETTLKIGRRRKKVTFSLVNRHHMICRVLLGREALAGDFVVDSAQKYLHGKRRKPEIQ